MEMILENESVVADQHLMNGILERQPAALDHLYTRYGGMLKSIIMQVLHDDSEADDVLQEVLVQVWDRATTYSSSKGKLMSWLSTLARRRAIDRLRQHSAYRRVTDRYEISCNHSNKGFEESHTVEQEAFCDDLRSLPSGKPGGRSEFCSPLRKVALLGNYIPRRCGLATFTADLHAGIATRYPDLQCPVVAVNDRSVGYNYPAEVQFEIFEPDVRAYRRAANFLNLANADVLCVQHEFGIFGGSEGSHVLALLREVSMPIVTTLHTILRNPTPEQRRTFEEVLRLSHRLVVMSKKAADFLREIYHVKEAKVDLIPHGIPDIPFTDSNVYKEKFGVGGKQVVFTFGLLSPNKGIENVLNALPGVVANFPNVVYIILGATHPNLVRDKGEAYRLSLERLVKENGLENHVIFFDRFVESEELTKFIGAADIYITPYLNVEQITSGALAYGFGAGKAVVSTPYWHAAELLADECGILVPFNDPSAIGRAINDLLSNEKRRHTMGRNAYRIGRKMVWAHVARLYLKSFERTLKKWRESRGAISVSAAAKNCPDGFPQAQPPSHLAWAPAKRCDCMAQFTHPFSSAENSGGE
jgi:RNA polymerase sigma factor (sigma-70 family)